MADPYFASVVLLAVNDNAADGTTTFVDQSSYARAITANGSVQYDTANAPTGMTSSCLFEGTLDFLSMADAIELEFGTSDFTIEFMVDRNAAANQEYIGKRANGSSFGWALFNQTGTNCVAYISSNGTTWGIASNQAIAAVGTTWEHVALSRQGSTFYPADNGTIGTTWTSALGIVNNAQDIRIGSCSDTFSFTGWMSNIRITIGVARYTADFTPPTLPFPTSAVDPPVADFSGTPLSGEVPLNVAFTDLSTNTPTGWAWTFGDGDVASTQNPSHTYTAAGTYTVGLTATNAAGSDLETKTDYITVTDTSDTHDGFKRRREVEITSFEDENRRIEARRMGEVRQLVEDSPSEEVVALVAPHTETLESGAKRIDYEAIRNDKALQAKLVALVEAEAARRERLAIEEDDEEVILLAIN